ncbi:head-tail connector protein [Metabacillus fastidiosus]|uniref:head-tail connector protein n=1 Tax=Metabacillus fastidiosus TaxID=1458 RepID=UPI003D267FB3
MLGKVKLALRISHNALDSEISDLIDAARHDLILSGISSVKANDDTDPLIKRSITTYVKANFISDSKEAERFQTAYNLLKNHITLAGDYTSA